jgi:hypothetical protein
MVGLFKATFLLPERTQLADQSVIVYLEEPGVTSSAGDGPVPEDEEVAVI